VTDLSERIRKAKRVFLIGNGGSASNCCHICNDLESCGIRAYVMNEATKSAWENDYSHEYVFAKWIELHGEPGDLLIALSGSGKSPNILAAVAEAERIGMNVERVFGTAQGLDMQAAEEAQIKLGHDLMRRLRAN
jgi:D-sedoheptulose 7-phosphate isomerase